MLSQLFGVTFGFVTVNAFQLNLIYKLTLISLFQICQTDMNCVMRARDGIKINDTW